MTLNCVIIDDEPLAAELLESYAQKVPFLRVEGVYNSATQAIKTIREKKIDLIFLDIQMPELSGLEFARIISKETKIVFTTAFNQYAIDGYNVNALDYLLKPISFERFLQTANKALEWFDIQDRQKTMRRPVRVREKRIQAAENQLRRHPLCRGSERLCEILFH